MRSRLELRLASACRSTLREANSKPIMNVAPLAKRGYAA